MEKLTYIVEDKTIAELLGVQNFTTAKAAVLELVKNSYDAGADNCDIYFSADAITFVDDGIGMDSDDIKKHWMHVGKSEKGYSTSDSNGAVRILSGSKGIGRFALSRLGEIVKLKSKKKNSSSSSVVWSTDWNSSLLDTDNGELVGTHIYITNTREKWNRKSVMELRDYLSRSYNDEKMAIRLHYQNEIFEVEIYFDNPVIGHNCTSIIELHYDHQTCKLAGKIYNDEFRKSAGSLCPDINLQEYPVDLNIYEELVSDGKINLVSEELKSELDKLGSFKMNIFFSLTSSTKEDYDKFQYKHSKLINRYQSGVTLYRNAFSINSFDGSKDWLGFDKRSRLSPAAATHQTGAWRVRENQISGKITIDKQENFQLKDMSNRQGLEENISYQLFGLIILLGITTFERYRQRIIRAINKINQVPKEEPTLVDEILKNPEKITSLSQTERKKFINELNIYKKQEKNYRDEKTATENQHRYDIRILNVLSTIGLKAASIAHEMQNDENNIAGNCDYIIEALKKYNLWEVVSDQEHTRYAYSNIPSLLEQNRVINEKTVLFMNTMLEEIEREKFNVTTLNISSTIQEIKESWERDYSWLHITIDCNPDMEYRTSEDVLMVIFYNLILNSVQQNEHLNAIKITIKVNTSDQMLYFKYEDDGKGLADKYKEDPFRILEVHETSRRNGHGLGMWIVNNTIHMTGGSVSSIKPDNGFGIDFSMGERLR